MSPYLNIFHTSYISSCLLLRYASQNSLDESSQNKLPRTSKDKTTGTYQNDEHTPRCFKAMNEMRKYVNDRPGSARSATQN